MSIFGNMMGACSDTTQVSTAMKIIALLHSIERGSGEIGTGRELSPQEEKTLELAHRVVQTCFVESMKPATKQGPSNAVQNLLEINEIYSKMHSGKSP